MILKKKLLHFRKLSISSKSTQEKKKKKANRSGTTANAGTRGGRVSV